MNLKTTQRETEETSRQETDSCPECDGALIVQEDRAETVCEDCGLVVEEEGIDPGPE